MGLERGATPLAGMLAPSGEVGFEVVGTNEIFDVQEGSTLEPDVYEGGLKAG